MPKAYKPPQPVFEDEPSDPGKFLEGASPPRHEPPMPSPPPPGPKVVRYEQRIRVLEAYRYDGRTAEAPEWIDRNWVVWDNGDDERRPGPALAVPGQKHQCRVGDYIVRQAVRMSAETEDVSVEVWRADEFERLFIPLPPVDTVINEPNPAQPP